MIRERLENVGILKDLSRQGGINMFLKQSENIFYEFFFLNSMRMMRKEDSNRGYGER